MKTHLDQNSASKRFRKRKVKKLCAAFYESHNARTGEQKQPRGGFRQRRTIAQTAAERIVVERGVPGRALGNQFTIYLPTRAGEGGVRREDGRVERDARDRERGRRIEVEDHVRRRDSVEVDRAGARERLQNNDAFPCR